MISQIQSADPEIPPVITRIFEELFRNYYFSKHSLSLDYWEYAKFVTPGSSEKFGDFILNSSNRMEDSVQHMIEIWEKQNESDQSSDSSILGPIFDLPCICTAFQYSKGHWVTIVFFLSQFIFDVSKDPITTDPNAQLLILMYDGLKDSTIKRDHLMKFPRSIGLQMVAAIF